MAIEIVDFPITKFSGSFQFGLPEGKPMVNLWLTYGFPMVFLWLRWLLPSLAMVRAARGRLGAPYFPGIQRLRTVTRNVG